MKRKNEKNMERMLDAMKLVIATRNRGKLREFERLFSDLEIELLTLDDIGMTEEIEETGSTFEENAYIKAKAASDFSNLPAFSDDSGLEVDYLMGQPGIYSARYGGEGLTDRNRMNLLLEKMKDVSLQMRDAQFVCAICLVFPDGRKRTVRRTCKGRIAEEPKGTGGFGYDPIFLYDTRTFAEMNDREKDRISHRGKATEDFKSVLENILESRGN